MKTAKFNYPKEFTELAQYSLMRGEMVNVVRELIDGVEYDNEGEKMFQITNNSGWTGHAWESELEEIS